MWRNKMSTNPTFEALTIKELAQRLNMSVEALQPKIPEKYKLKIGKSIRYDLYGVIEYFRCGEDKHLKLINNLLK